MCSAWWQLLKVCVCLCVCSCVCLSVCVCVCECVRVAALERVDQLEAALSQALEKLSESQDRVSKLTSHKAEAQVFVCFTSSISVGCRQFSSLHPLIYQSSACPAGAELSLLVLSSAQFVHVGSRSNKSTRLVRQQ